MYGPVSSIFSCMHFADVTKGNPLNKFKNYNNDQLIAPWI